MRAWPVWLLLLTTLAGCTNGGDVGTEGTPALALPGIGNMRGLVVDDAIVPIEGARILLKNIELEAFTGVDGTFGVDNLEEGPYRVRITKLDHDPQELTIQVVAGVEEPTAARIQLTRVAGSVPLAVPAVHTGWIGCEALVLYALQNCDGGTSTFGPPDNHLVMSQPDGVPDAVHVEVAWEATQDFAKSLTLTFGTCSGVAYCDPQPPSKTYLCTAWGASPLWCRVDQVGAERSGEGTGHQNLRDTGHGTKPLTGLAIHVGADCTHCLVSPYESWGLGLAVQQDFDVFTWSFFNFQPAEGWSFVRDGEPKP